MECFEEWMGLRKNEWVCEEWISMWEMFGFVKNERVREEWMSVWGMNDGVRNEWVCKEWMSVWGMNECVRNEWVYEEWMSVWGMPERRRGRRAGQLASSGQPVEPHWHSTSSLNKKWRSHELNTVRLTNFKQYSILIQSCMKERNRLNASNYVYHRYIYVLYSYTGGTDLKMNENE